LPIPSSVSVAASGRTSLSRARKARGGETQVGASGCARTCGEGGAWSAGSRAAEAAGCERSGVEWREASGMAEAADYVVPAIAITAATALTFIAVSFNELREVRSVLACGVAGCGGVWCGGMNVARSCDDMRCGGM
ncbi:unnamed protein product, partial [Closterium sp. NIES-53]